MRLGIDPGMSGALALVEDEKVWFLADMPVTEKTHGKGKMVNPYLLADIVDEAIEIAKQRDTKLVAVIEQVSAMPGQGVSSMFNFGRSLGIVEGVLGWRMTPVSFVTPQRWKKQAGLIGKDKDASRTAAIRMFPEVADQLSRKKDNGRADAIFIAKVDL